ncbi:MAG: nucleotide exchange factor GrpE [Candidatus Binatia bacterium]
MAEDRTENPQTPTESTRDPAARVSELEAELAAAREEASQSHDRWVRERADLENLKRRAAREQTEAVRFGNEQLLRDLLPVVDNLERALEHARSATGTQTLTDGVSLVLKNLMDVLDRHGVTRVPAQGARFDPEHHEAVAHVESAEHEANAVMAEHQPGYRLRERLLRPALVTVAKAPAGGNADGNLANDQGRG